MHCKRCGTKGNGINVSVYQNTFPEFPSGQYIFLCVDCYGKLKYPGIKKTYEELLYEV